MSKKDAPKKPADADVVADEAQKLSAPAAAAPVAAEPSAFARVVTAIAEVVRPSNAVDFTDHTGTARRAKVNSGGYVEMIAAAQLDGVQNGERFGERPALAFRLVAEGKARLVDEAAFAAEDITSVREDGGDDASTDLATA